MVARVVARWLLAGCGYGRIGVRRRPRTMVGVRQRRAFGGFSGWRRVGAASTEQEHEQQRAMIHALDSCKNRTASLAWRLALRRPALPPLRIVVVRACIGMGASRRVARAGRGAARDRGLDSQRYASIARASGAADRACAVGVERVFGDVRLVKAPSFSVRLFASR